MFKEALGYVEKTGLLGEIVGADFRNKQYRIEDENGVTTNESIEDVEVLDKVLEANGIPLYDKDVLSDVDNNLFLLENHGDKGIQFHKLNDRLEIEVSGMVLTISKDVIDQIENNLVIEANYYELVKMLPQAPDFNIKFVKEFDGTHFTYFYACNNKENQEIDLIKVVFIGHQALEEDYERVTISYDDFAEFIETGRLETVSPQELQNYALGATYPHRYKAQDTSTRVSEAEVKVQEVQEPVKEKESLWE